ncbi:retrovirus-related pol polyprotein from transposon TNT 1-94 [Tanacetum coccineum]
MKTLLRRRQSSLETIAPPLVSSSEEQTSPISTDVADEVIQKDSAELDKNTLITPFNHPVFEEAESTLTTQNPLNMHEFNQYYQPKNIKEEMLDHGWIESMQDDLHQFKRLNVWELVPRPTDRNIIGVKWICKNKTNAENTVIRKKSRLVAKGYREEEGIYLEKSSALVARLEAARMFITYAAHKNFTFFKWTSKLLF